MPSWVERWMSGHALLLLLSTIFLYFLDALNYLAIPASLSFLVFIFWNASQQKSFSFLLQAANLVTGFRLLALLITSVLVHLPPLYIGILALVVLCLDGLDGFLARKYQTASLFGEYLDMETDAYYVLCLSALLYDLGYFGSWILGIGLLRYSYFLLLRKTKAPQQKEARIYFARLVAVILMATLAAGFILPTALHQPLMVIAALLVVYSFGNSFWLAWREGGFRA